MVEVYDRLWVGSDMDVISVGPDWAVLHAAKEPWHREFVGYSGRSAPKESPEYLWAVRGNRLALNLVDSDRPEYILAEVIWRGLDFIGEHIGTGRNVLVQCNHGCSRSPGIAFLYLDRIGVLPKVLEEALAEFRQLYPAFTPAGGMMGFIEFHFGLPQI